MYRLIEARVAWMDRAGLDAWNRNGYLEAYPASYYRRRAEAGTAYGLWRAGRLCAAAVLLAQDPCWTDEAPARYVHHLVSAPEAKGAGAVLLARLEAEARSQGAAYLRLDAAARSAALNAFYAARGYREAGVCQDGPYRGILREKTLLP